MSYYTEIGFKIAIDNTARDGVNYVRVPNINNIGREESTICFFYRADELLTSYGTVFHLISNDGGHTANITFGVRSDGYRITVPNAIRKTIEVSFIAFHRSMERPVCIAWSVEKRHVRVHFNGNTSHYDDIIRNMPTATPSQTKPTATLLLGTEAEMTYPQDGGTVAARTDTKYTGDISYMLIYDRMLRNTEMSDYTGKRWPDDDSLVFRWNMANFRDYFHGNISVHLIK